tara:strand:+ start:776 stop:1414 length:639 start_codon:yes stop_codon:yes gene_type:complete
MNRKIILSSHYFPCIAYFAYLVNFKNVTIDIGENFIKQSYRNRCIIYGSNGLLPVSIPVNKKNTSKTKDVVIDTKENWRKNHWRAISSAYSSSPFFEFYCDNIEKVLFQNNVNLSSLNIALTELICCELNLSINLKISTKYVLKKETDIDLRDKLSPKTKFNSSILFPRYIQTFEFKHGFQKNLSILDLLFHEGPESISYLKKLHLDIIKKP